MLLEVSNCEIKSNFRPCSAVQYCKDYIAQDRIFGFEDFEDRWWDFNELTDASTGETRLVEDYHMMFIVTPKQVLFPLELGMKRDSELDPGR
jgi:hypothetical protein